MIVRRCTLLLALALLVHPAWAQQEDPSGHAAAEHLAGGADAQSPSQGSGADSDAPPSPEPGIENDAEPDPGTEDGPATDRTSEAATAEREEAARLREAINENLVPDRPSETAVDADEPDTTEDPEPTPSVASPDEPTPTPEVLKPDFPDTNLRPDADPQAAEPTPDDVDDVPGVEVPAEPPDEEYWYERYADIATRLGALPEHIPGLAGKGWLHFGRVELEAARFSKGDLEDDSGFNFRSLRGGLIRQVNENLLVKFEVDLTDGDSNFTDLYGRYNTKLGLFTIGNQKIAQTLVNQTSRLSRTFMEEPLPADAFGLGRRLGVGWDLKLRRVGAHLTAFGPDLNEQIGKFGYGIRAHANPALDQFNMVHVGASAVQEQMDRDAQFRAYPESRVTDLRLVDTGRIEDVDTQSIFGLELAAARMNYAFRSEVFRARWERSGGDSTTFAGAYLQANAILTGESFQYAQGKFLRVRPQSSRGAWELGLRYSTVDLREDDINGGRQTNTTLALNWYAPGEQLRVMGNIIYVDADTPDGGRETPWILQLRAQVHW